MDRTDFYQNDAGAPDRRPQPTGHWELGQARFFFNSNQPTLAEIYAIAAHRAKRLWTAAKFQFHQKTFGVFEKARVRKLTFLGLAGLFLFEAEPDFLTSIGRPIVSIISADDFELDRNAARLDLTETTSRPSAKAQKVRLDDGGNPYAPVGKGALRAEEAESYIQKFAPIAQAEMKKFGIPASIALAQGLVESRAGTSRLARNNNNHFGMKCFSRRCPKGHCTNATDDHHKDFFRKYQSAWESWREHSKLLATGHYSRLKKYGSDYRQWAYGLKACGYATDRTYAEKLIGMIERYDLHRFDR